MTHHRATTGTIGLVLPADWHVVDLTNDTTRHADLTALVDRQVPRRDDLATVRRRLRREVEQSSWRAAQAGGRFSAYMLTAVGPVALPAVLTAYRTPGSLAADEDLDALATTLARRQDASASVDVTDSPLGPVLRSVAVRASSPASRGEGRGVGPADEPGPELLVCDYWSDPPDDDGLLLLSFSTPVLPLRDALLDLFDTIAGSTRVTPAEPCAAPAADALLDPSERRRARFGELLADTSVPLDEEEDAEVVREQLRAVRRAVAAERRGAPP